MCLYPFRLQEALQRNAELAEPGPPARPLSTVVIYDVHNGDRRPAALVRHFGELYSVWRLETLDALDGLSELMDADELKNKLLFSVVVVSMTFLASWYCRARVEFISDGSCHSARRPPAWKKSETK